MRLEEWSWILNFGLRTSETFYVNTEFMREAIRLSRRKMRANQGGPFGAVIVRRGKIMARGWNRVTTAADPTAHAEITAIRDACKKLKRFHLDDCELYTSCEPCPMCLGAIYWARLKRVFYATTRADVAAIHFDDLFIYEEIDLPLSRRAIPMKPLLRAEALKVFAEWRKKADKVLY
jgi:guanine deaminase